MNKPVKKTGGLVDFKENVIYEKEKDNPIKSAERFRYKCIKDYGFNGSTTDLYRKIVNHQIKKYGKTLTQVIEMPTFEERMKKCTYKKSRIIQKLKGRKADEK